MKTLLEQWNYYDSEIKKREAKFVFENVLNHPTNLYRVSPNGKIQIYNIDKVEYCNKQWFEIGKGRKRPSKPQVEQIKYYFENADLDLDKILFHYHYFIDLGGRCSGAFKFSDLNTYLNKEQAETKSLEFSDKYKHEQGLVDKGTHIRCERCRKITETDKVVNFHLHSYVNYGSQGRNGKFCSGECAGNEQMSLEG